MAGGLPHSSGSLSLAVNSCANGKSGTQRQYTEFGPLGSWCTKFLVSAFGQEPVACLAEGLTYSRGELPSRHKRLVWPHLGLPEGTYFSLL